MSTPPRAAPRTDPSERDYRTGVEIEIRRARRMETCSNWPRFLKPLYDPGRTDFPSPVLASALYAFLRARLPPARETAVLAHPSPRRGGVCLAPSPRCRPRVTRRCVRSVPSCRGHRVPRAPLPEAGVTRAGAASRPPGEALPPRRRSYGLMRQTTTLPAPPVFPLCARSLQVVASPCWAMALPDIISATLA